MKKKGLVKTVQVNHFSVSPKCFNWKSLNVIKCGYYLSIGFPRPVWQDRGLYIRPPIKDPVEKSRPGGVAPTKSSISCAYTLLCEQLQSVQTASSVDVIFVYLLLGWCEWESPLHRESCEQKQAGYWHWCWDTFSELKRSVPRDIVTTVTLCEERCFELWQIM